MTRPFDYFIILAAMRTGSNLLEANLNALDGITCHGEAFNPHFIGRVKAQDVLGITLEQRDKDPAQLIEAMRSNTNALNGFRYFQDHDSRVLESALNNPRCAKIILTRNPLDSYLSLKIVRKTKQWQLKNIKRRLEAQVDFDGREFSDYLDQHYGFQSRLRAHLQRSGQAAFYIDYNDLTDLSILNGLAAWLGVSSRLGQLDDRLKPQNPTPALSKVTNPDEMQKTLSGLDLLSITRSPSFEPKRDPAVDGYIIAAETPLIYLPLGGGIEPDVQHWMAALDGVNTSALRTDLTPNMVRDWMRSSPGHRKFTVLRHPLSRAHSAFCTHILNKGPECYEDIRTQLRNRFKLPIPGQVREKNYSKDQHYEAFSAFLTFLRHNIAGQTPIRVDASWCTQAQALEGISTFAMPDLILREDELATALPDLARNLGHGNAPTPETSAAETPFSLDQICDEALQALAAETYQRDFDQFGFGEWRPVRPAG